MINRVLSIAKKGSTVVLAFTAIACSAREIVEIIAPNAEYPAAFVGQTRIDAVSTQTKYSVTSLVQGLNSPWGMASLPDGRILVTEKKGTMRIVSLEGGLGEPITGFPAINSDGQGGLLDVAIDANFSENRTLYWTFSLDGKEGTRTALAKGQLADDEKTVLNPQVIYQAVPEFDGKLHYGSRLEWDGQGNLFMSTGERSSADIRHRAQDLDVSIGKVLRLTTDGDAVADNPFVGQMGVLPEIYSYGHRHPQGLATHPETKQLWEAEFGPRGGDEVNLIQPGNNYGWPVITYGIEYYGPAIGDGITQQEGMEQPIYYWDPSVSPSGITFYSGSLIPEWRNNLFLATLSGQHIVRLVIEENKVIGEERLLVDKASRFRDVLEGSDGALYAFTDGDNATLYRISN